MKELYIEQIFLYSNNDNNLSPTDGDINIERYPEKDLPPLYAFRCTSQKDSQRLNKVVSEWKTGTAIFNGEKIKIIC